MGWFYCPKCKQPRKLNDHFDPNRCWKCNTPETEGVYPWPDEGIRGIPAEFGYTHDTPPPQLPPEPSGDE
jgi:hypothetical protein